MAKGNLKGLGPGIGARNSLGRPAGGNSTNEPPSKRQRVGSSPVRLSEILPLKTQKPKPGDVDSYEFSSTTDAGSGKQLARATQSQYRGIQAQSGSQKKVRTRKSRQSKSAGASSRATPSADPDERHPSPDPLVEDPPPSNITSDVGPFRGGVKRPRRTSIPEPHVKRSRATSTRRESIDNIPDELALEEKVKSSSQKPILRAATSSNERRGPSRVDIKPTNFSSSKTNPGPRGRKQEMPFHVKSAVCGNSMIKSTSIERYSLAPPYNVEGKVEELHLLLEKVDAEGNSLESLPIEEEIARCFGIDFEKLKTVQQRMTYSQFIMAERRLSTGQPPKLNIEFSSVAECTRLLGLLPAEQCLEVEHHVLEKQFNHSLQEARKRQTRVKATTPNQEQPKSIEQSEVSSSGQQQLIVAIPSRQQTRRTGRLKDQMSTVDEEAKEQRITSDLTDAAPPKTPAPQSYSPRVRTRRSTTTHDPDVSGSAYPARESSISRWTVQNAEWESRWLKSLVYPPTGRNRTVVDADDIPRLDDGECLNDNIINFYLRWLKMNVERDNPDVLKKVHIFESYFFERLKKSKYPGVRSWTAKLDLLSYDYIVVPVNENYHWYLAIICNVAKALPSDKPEEAEEEMPEEEMPEEEMPEKRSDDGEPPVDDSSNVNVVQERVKAISIEDAEPAKSSPTEKKNGDDPYRIPDTPPPEENAGNASKAKGKKSKGPPPQKFDPKEPRIITLDSLGGAHSPTCRILREYLTAEANDKREVELEAAVPGMTAKGIPLQSNSFDCGTYTLAFIEKFLEDPDKVARQLLQKESLDWDVDSATMRVDIRELLFTLQNEQQERLTQELAEKKAKKRSKSLANGGAMSSPGPMVVPTASQEASREAALKHFASSPPGVQASADTSKVDESEDEDQPTPVISKCLDINDKRQPTPIPDKKPKLISPLVDSEENTPGEPSDAFYSARTTPTPKVNGKPQPFTACKSSSKSVTKLPSFVQEIPSSDSELEEVDVKTKKPMELDLEAKKEAILPSIEQSEEDAVQPSVERDEENQRPEPGGFIHNMGKFFGVKAGVWGSPEGKKRATYDGIDRS